MTVRDTIDRYYETVNARDWDAWLDLFSNDVVVDEQLAGHSEGLDALRGVGDGIQKGYSRLSMTPIHVVIQDDEACVIWHCEAANASGVPIDALGANYFRLEGDRIVYMSNYHDTVPFEPFTSQNL